MISPDLFLGLTILMPVAIGAILLFFSRWIHRFSYYVVFMLCSFLLIVVSLWWSLSIGFQNFGFMVDHLSRTMLLWSAFFSWIIMIYAKGYFEDSFKATQFYGYALITLGTAFFTILSDHAILLAIGWGLLGLWLYLMILISDSKNARDTAKKTLIMVGGSDILMILGLAILYYLMQSWNFSSIHVSLDSTLAILSFSLIFVGAFAKAGVFPFHSWLPDACQHSHVPVTSFLPLSLDKLIGIYFMFRLVGSIFVMNATFVFILMSLGCICIFAGVMMALVQHDLRRLLGYHAISQVGYMVLGLGTGTAMGMLGAIYHLVNNMVYKTLLFISGGLIGKKCNTFDLDRLGGLMKYLPITFFVMLISSLAIAGVYPFNGYFSKHVVLHGIEYAGKNYQILSWPLFYLLASFGGLLTLSSFVKVMYAMFIEPPCQSWDKVKENNGWMLSSMILLAMVCLGLSFTGWFYRVFLVDMSPKEVSWNFSVTEGLIYAIGYCLVAFIIIKLLKRHARTCQTIGIHLYEKVRNLKGLKVAYDVAEKKYTDLYDIGKRMVEGFSFAARSLHTGILPTYVFWLILGTLIFTFYYFSIF